VRVSFYAHHIRHFSYLICGNIEDLKEKAKWKGSTSESRRNLLASVQSKFDPEMGPCLLLAANSKPCFIPFHRV
jgi:hypothetical protein